MIDESIPCTWMDESICIDCGLNESLNCRYDEELVVCFRRRHIPFRLFQFLIVGLASLFTGLWWLFIFFAIIIMMNFLFIETWYLCRHCPFYAKEGNRLECITLKGLLKPWKYSPSPISRAEKIMMGIFGGFSDVFPLIAGGYACWILFIMGADILLLGTMVLLTLLSIGAAAYLGKFLGDNFCMKCINLSCFMNKVPKEIVDAYLQRNPDVKDAHESRV